MLERFRETRPLLLVTFGYVLVQLIVLSSRPALGWDESIYVSQVSGDGPTAWFGAPRARGVTLLPAPVAELTSSTAALRIWMIALSAVALYAAFRTWSRVCGPTIATAAAAGFVALWVTEYYGNQVMPNLWVAFGAVAAAAFVVRALRFGGWRPLVGAALNVAWMALVRPTDALWLLVGFIVAIAVATSRTRWRDALRLGAAVTVGFVAGTLEWILEAVVRFGGVGARLHAASVQNETGLRVTIAMHARAVNGPLLCRPCDSHSVLVVGALWWILVAALVAVALLRGRTDGTMQTFLVPTLGAAGSAASYFFLVGYAAPRFLLPAYALLSVPAAAGAFAVFRWAGSRYGAKTTFAAACLVAALFLTEQGLVLVHLVRVRSHLDRINAAVVQLLQRAGVSGNCTVGGPVTYQIPYAAGCRDDLDAVDDMRRASGGSVADRDAGDELADGATLLATHDHSAERYALVVPSGRYQKLPPPFRSWQRTVVGHRYVVYLPPDRGPRSR